jgi:thiamine biosynthesis lipoprotein
MQGRRRFVSILAACGAMAPLAYLCAEARASPAATTSAWKGTAMGALASMTLVHPEPAKARALALIRQCVDEIDRLEAIFSLYRADSSLCRLNATGELQAPPHELTQLLAQALALARDSDGSFDPTVQPLCRLYADHFSRPGAARGGPDGEAIAQALRRVDFRAVEVGSDRIRLRRAGMAITLNGIAQGYVTDRIADLLRGGGFGDVLIDLGEARALGRRPGGGPWRAAIADPQRPQRTLIDLPLGETPGAFPALATSAGYGSPFGSDPRIHHLLDPHTGRSANHHASVSVGAQRAALADGLSTTLALTTPSRVDALLARYAPVQASIVDNLGRVRHVNLAR